MKINNRTKIILTALLVLVMGISYVANRFGRKSNQRSEQPGKADGLHYCDEEKVDSYNQTKREDAQRREKLIQEATKSGMKRTQLTIDGWDPETKSAIDQSPYGPTTKLEHMVAKYDTVKKSHLSDERETEYLLRQILVFKVG